MNDRQQVPLAPHAKDVYSRPNETMGLAPRFKGDKLTAMVKKLYAVVLLVSQEQGGREEYSIPLGQLLVRGNIDSKNMKLIRGYLEAMRRFSVTWNTRKGEEVEWRNTGLLKEVWITQGQGKAATLYWELSKKIRERLIDPESFFTRLSLQMMTSLRSGSSITLYEICCQYASNDRNGEGGLTRRAGFEWWRPRLSGSLEEDEGPQAYKYFKRDMLMPAIKEINEITDIEVELVEHRVGRKIEEIQFLVRKKAKPTLPLLAVASVDSALVARLVRLGLTAVAAERLCLDEDARLIEQTATMVEKRMATGRVVASSAAYFTKAFREKWALAAPAEKTPAHGAPLLHGPSHVDAAVQPDPGKQVHSTAPRPSPNINGMSPNPARTLEADRIEMIPEVHLAELPAWQANYERYLQAPETLQSALLELYKSVPNNPFAQEVRKNGLFKKLVRVDFGQWLAGRV